MFQECPGEVSKNEAECGVCNCVGGYGCDVRRGEWEERCSDEVRADIEGSALHSSLLELVIVENEGILLYGSMFATCFRFVEVVDTCGSNSDEHDKRSIV